MTRSQMPAALTREDLEMRRAAERGLARDAVLQAVAAGPGEADLDEIAARVARAVSVAEKRDREAWEARFTGWIREGLFLPSVPVLSNAGRSGKLAACFVLQPEDSLESIYETLHLAARIQQGSGGSGIDFSGLRPRDAPIEASGGVSPGPVTFLELYAHSARVNARAGRRPGAHLAVLRDDHPDILEFVRAISVHPEGLGGVGLAVGIRGELLEEAERGELHRLRDPRGGSKGAVDARMLLEEIACSIHQTGDPTLLFLDTIARHNPTPHLGPIEATNPCGEQPLLAGESCVLGSLHLPAFADEQGELDLDRLAEATRDAIRFLDDVVDVNVYPDEWIARTTLRTRKLGLGVMGLADLFLARGARYGSPSSLEVARGLMATIARAAAEATEALADARGPYPAWRGDGPRRRNATVLAIAPTGTLRLVAGCSGGIEPFIRPVVVVRSPAGIARWVNPWIDRWLNRRLADPERILRLLEEGAPSTDLADVSPTERELLHRAWEVLPADQILVQAEVQRFVDGAVSKTVHLPTAISLSSIVELIRLAYRCGCKGVAFFRRGSERPLQRSLPVEIDLSPPCCLS